MKQFIFTFLSCLFIQFGFAQNNAAIVTHYNSIINGKEVALTIEQIGEEPNLTFSGKMIYTYPDSVMTNDLNIERYQENIFFLHELNTKNYYFLKINEKDLEGTKNSRATNEREKVVFTKIKT